jgi:hypothetical protein
VSYLGGARPKLANFDLCGHDDVRWWCALDRGDSLKLSDMSSRCVPSMENRDECAELGAGDDRRGKTSESPAVSWRARSATLAMTTPSTTTGHSR